MLAAAQQLPCRRQAGENCSKGSSTTGGLAARGSGLQQRSAWTVGVAADAVQGTTYDGACGSVSWHSWGAAVRALVPPHTRRTVGQCGFQDKDALGVCMPGVHSLRASAGRQRRQGQHACMHACCSCMHMWGACKVEALRLALQSGCGAHMPSQVCVSGHAQ